jgi:hypothetical protein
MPFKDLLPFQQAPPAPPQRAIKQAEVIKPKTQKALSRIMKATTIALGIAPAFTGRSNWECSPYDFDTIIQAVDSDSYVKQAFHKYKELMWKSGFDLVSENPEAASYIRLRFEFMELAMKMPMQQFFETVGDQLVKFYNCFIVKSRGDLAPYFPAPLKGLGGQLPLVGYEIVPAETMRIKRDKNNNPTKYMQELDGFGGYGQPRAPQWDPSEVIHLHIDRKPGQLFGTPFMTANIEDIRSLRQLEEDILNMVHQELYPFYSVTVGTEDEPGEDDEIIQAAEEIAAMRNDGAMVHSERRKIEVIGAEGQALDASPYLEKMTNRVIAGLGLSPHHLGIMSSGGNRAVTDRLDIALYDKVKVYQRYKSEAIRIFILNELLLEGGYRPFTDPMRAGISDRVEFRFREIDKDTQIKTEAHALNLYTGDLIGRSEARMRIDYEPEAEEHDTHSALQARLAPDQVVKNPVTGASAPVDTTPKTAKRDGALPSTGGKPNAPNLRKGPGNTIRPANQHGRRKSPNVRHDDYVDMIVELLDEPED